MQQDSARPERKLALSRNEKSMERIEDEIDAEIALATLASVECDPSQVVRGEELAEELREIVG